MHYEDICKGQWFEDDGDYYCKMECPKGWGRVYYFSMRFREGKVVSFQGHQDIVPVDLFIVKKQTGQPTEKVAFASLKPGQWFEDESGFIYRKLEIPNDFGYDLDFAMHQSGTVESFEEGQEVGLIEIDSYLNREKVILKNPIHFEEI